MCSDGVQFTISKATGKAPPSGGGDALGSYTDIPAYGAADDGDEILD